MKTASFLMILDYFWIRSISCQGSGPEPITSSYGSGFRSTTLVFGQVTKRKSNFSGVKNYIRVQKFCPHNMGFIGVSKDAEFKETVSRDFRPLVFFIYQLPLGP
jgi:hypothetical protein